MQVSNSIPDLYPNPHKNTYTMAHTGNHTTGTKYQHSTLYAISLFSTS